MWSVEWNKEGFKTALDVLSGGAGVKGAEYGPGEVAKDEEGVDYGVVIWYIGEICAGAVIFGIYDA
jgi:hypothetical protein